MESDITVQPMNPTEPLESQITSYLNHDDYLNNSIAPDPGNQRASEDILGQIPNMYRLLELTNDGTDKILIHQESISRLTNKMQPGSYVSMTKIDFKQLDHSSISPVGIYGSRSKILDWLSDEELVPKHITARLKGDDMMVSARLSPGLYLVEGASPVCYVIFWPEDGTWTSKDTDEMGKNRVTFMRYLTKLCDQIYCLVSDQDITQIIALEKWNETGTTLPNRVTRRVYSRTVAKTSDQEEKVTANKGPEFTLPVSDMPPRRHGSRDLEYLDTRFVTGNSHQGIVLSYRRQAETLFNDSMDNWNLCKLQHFLSGSDDKLSLRIARDIDLESFDFLLDAGLSRRFTPLYDDWLRQINSDEAQEKQDFEKRRTEYTTGLINQSHWIRHGLLWMSSSIVYDLYRDIPCRDIYESIQLDLIHEQKEIEDEASSSSDDLLKGLLMTTPGLEDEIIQTFQELSLSQSQWNKQNRYHIIRDAWSEVHKTVDLSKLPEEEKVNLVDILCCEDSLTLQRDFTRWKQQVPDNKWAAVKKVSSKAIKKISNVLRKPKDNNEDLDFLASLNTNDIPFLEPVITVIKDAAKQALKAAWESAIQAAFNLVVSKLQNTFKQKLQSESKVRCEAATRSLIATLDDELERSATHDVLVIHHVSAQGDKCMVSGQLQHIIPMATVAELWKLQVTSIGIPTTNRMYSVELGPTEHLQDMLFLGSDYVLVISKTDHNVTLTLHDFKRNHRHSTLHLALEKLGSVVCFAYEESSNSLATIVTEVDLSSHLIIHELQGSKFTSYPHRMLNDFPFETKGNIVLAQFIPKQNTLVMVDHLGQMALFSRSTNQFRPRKIVLAAPPTFLQVTPDGSWILSGSIDRSGELKLQAFHVKPSGNSKDNVIDTKGFKSRSPKPLLSAMTDSPDLLLLGLHADKLTSIVLSLTSTANGYSIQASRDYERPSITKHLLLYTFTELWIRYPVCATIERTRQAEMRKEKAVCFVVSSNHDQFIRKFKEQLREFLTTHHKPTQRRLEDLSITATSTLPKDADLSLFHLGDWLVGLFCLIPIHIAITNANRFIPLKDGSISKDFESSLLGETVQAVANRLSFGWYESIFSSYLAKKPVRVVSSMGEQSIGKSYALNHLMDTSFAGSAMRCTEGAWLSVVPCDEELLVAMDFEGLNSVERTQQEDVLLVLFQTAISNLVLLRSHPAMSRTLTRLLLSFQKSSTALSPEANPGLFHSVLAFIIRDVPDADTNGVVQEFDEKLERIVSDEQEGNFISCLHRGKFEIILWPVISSSEFYRAFEDLKEILLGRPTTHQTGGDFLAVLKMVMAKIQACDWGSIEKDLAKQRAKVLADHLENAFVYGKMDKEGAVLTIMSTDEPLPQDEFNGKMLPIQGLFSPTLDVKISNSQISLCETWDGYSKRFSISEEEFTKALSAYLHRFTESRISLVEQWVNLNAAQYAGAPEVDQLISTIRNHASQIRGFAILCEETCANCGRKCITSRRHAGEHNCATDHACNSFCDFPNDHQEDAPPCTLPALHVGKHDCQTINHLCGDDCSLAAYGGCRFRCFKKTGHSDPEHSCGVKKHTCPQQCELAASGLQENGRLLCQGKCTVDCLEDHERHRCSQSNGCPFKCLLCSRLCGDADHLHGLDRTAVHLCGGEHDCKDLCEMSGVCEIQPQPLSIEATYAGRFGRFQYTLFTQKACRLRCKVKIPPGTTSHPEKHDHGDNFHFCEARCPQCGYFCDLPLGHPQTEHSTKHGSMKNTEWRIERRKADEGKITINGNWYGTGDAGNSMLCNMVCSQLGRHVHLERCRGLNGVCTGGEEVQHVHRKETGGWNGTDPYDWVSHRLFWERSGFRDPYGENEKKEFTKCEYRCSGQEHPEDDPSYCQSSLFHSPILPNSIQVPRNNYISQDGHLYSCRDPQDVPRHIIFIIDRSSSMKNADIYPDTILPGAGSFINHKNRYGAVIVAIYRFMYALVESQAQRHSFSCVLFAKKAEILFADDRTGEYRNVVAKLQESFAGGGTNFVNALQTGKLVMERHWDEKRLPVMIFLSDGEATLDDSTIRDVCDTAVEKGEPLSLYTVAFGQECDTAVLKRMTKIAREVYQSTKPDATYIPCEFMHAQGATQLEEVFLAIAESVRKDRATLFAR